jgi:hypothetical protein
VSAEQAPEPPTPSSLSPVLVVLGIGIVAAVILAFWLNARLVRGVGTMAAFCAYVIFSTIFVWLDRSVCRKLAAGPPIDEATLRHFLAHTAKQAALATPLTGYALLLVLSAARHDWLLPGLLILGSIPVTVVCFVVGLVGCARARRRVMVSPSPREG